MEKQRRLSRATELIFELCSDLNEKEYAHFAVPEYWAHGAQEQRQRIERVADWCANRYPGDLIEIGAYTGGTSRLLAEVAERYDRRLIIVDPWETGTQNCDGFEFEAFLRNTDSYRDIIDIFRTRSDNKKTIETIKAVELCFAFVDGLHTGPAVKLDIETIDHCNGIISVDDILYNAALRSAFVAKAVKLERAPVNSILWREGYLV